MVDLANNMLTGPNSAIGRLLHPAPAATVVPAPPTPITSPAPSGPSDFQTLAQALTAIYGGTTGSAAQQTVPTAVVPVNGDDGSGFSLAMFGPVFLLLTLAGVAYLGYRWWKSHHKGT